MSVFHPARTLLPREQRSPKEGPPVSCVAEILSKNAIEKTKISRQSVVASAKTTQIRKRVVRYFDVVGRVEVVIMNASIMSKL